LWDTLLVEGADASSLVHDWRIMNENPSPGVLYREICRQIPEWTAAVAQEVMEPNPFVFLDYTIMSPNTKLDILVGPR
jgi:hypothetical protein